MNRHAVALAELVIVTIIATSTFPLPEVVRTVLLVWNVASWLSFMLGLRDKKLVLSGSFTQTES